MARPQARLRLEPLERRDTPVAGALDPSFDLDGIRFLDEHSTVDGAGDVRAMAVDAAGNILLGGRNIFAADESQDGAVVIRLLPDGQLDPTFSTDGVAHPGIGNQFTDVRAMAVQPDGKIILAGAVAGPNAGFNDTRSDFVVARLNPNGGLDPTFGTNGLVFVVTFRGELPPGPGTPPAAVDAVAVRPDGKIVLTGFTRGGGAVGDGTYRLFAVRLAANGKPDPTFDTDGLATYDVQAQTFDVSSQIFRLGLRADGKAVIAGDTYAPDNSKHVTVVRLDQAGGLDPTFGGTGIIDLPAPDPSPEWHSTGLVLRADDKVVVTGYQNYASVILSDQSAVAARLNADGTLDPSYDGDGFALVPFDNQVIPSWVTSAQGSPDGRVVVTGYFMPNPSPPAGSDFGAIRFAPDGSADPTFAGDGQTIVGPSPAVTDIVTTGAFQADGKILIAGRSFNSSTGWSAITIMRITGDRPPADLRLDNDTVPENQPAGTRVGNLSAFDYDPGNTFAYSLVPGVGAADNASFQVVGTSLRTAAPFDFEGKRVYSIRLRVTDNTGLLLEEPFTIRVTNVNEAPTDLALSNASVGELAPAGALVGTLSATDQDVGDRFTFSLLDSAGGRFAVMDTNRLVVARANRLDFETSPTHTVRVRVKDVGGLSFDKSLVVTVLDQAEGRVIAFGVNGGKTQRSRVTSLTVTFGTAMTVDPDAFALVRDDAGAVPAIAFTTALVGGKTVATLTFSGAETQGGSLVDGRYRLTIDPTRVRETATGQELDGDLDGNPGGTYTSPSFHRLFGDVTGDGLVGSTDNRIYQIYRARGNGRAPGFVRLFDLDASGLVDGADDRQFQARRGRRV